MYQRTIKEIALTKKLNSAERLQYVRDKNSLGNRELGEMVGYTESSIKYL